MRENKVFRKSEVQSGEIGFLFTSNFFERARKVGGEKIENFCQMLHQFCLLLSC